MVLIRDLHHPVRVEFSDRQLFTDVEVVPQCSSTPSKCGVSVLLRQSEVYSVTSFCISCVSVMSLRLQVCDVTEAENCNYNKITVNEF